MKSLIIARNEILDKYLKDVEPHLNDLRAAIADSQYITSKQILSKISRLNSHHSYDIRMLEDVIQRQMQQNKEE